MCLKPWQLNNITCDNSEERNREDNKEEASDCAGEELFALFDLFGIVATGHNLNSPNNHDNYRDPAGNAG